MNGKSDDTAELMKVLAPVLAEYMVKVANKVSEPFDARIRSLSDRVADLEQRLGVKR